MEIKNWNAKTNNINIKIKKGKIVVSNNSNSEGKIYGTKIIKCNNDHINVVFKSNTINGTGAVLKLINRHKECKMDAMLNSECSSTEAMKGYLLPIIVLKPNTTIKKKKVEITTSKKPENTYNKFRKK